MCGDHIDRLRSEFRIVGTSFIRAVWRVDTIRPALQNPAPTFRRASLLTLVVASVSALIAAMPGAASAGVLFPDSAASPNTSLSNTLFFIVFGVGLIAVVAVIALFARAARPADEDAEAASVDESDKSLTAGIVLFAVFAVIGGYAFFQTNSAEPSEVQSSLKPAPLQDSKLRVAHNVKPPEGPSTSVFVTGQQFLWRYQYPGVKGDWNTYSYHDMVIPAGVTVMLDVTSSDVEHAWWVPQLGGSISAMPGYINRTWIRADAPGVFEGRSTVVSGTNFPSMTTRVIALEPKVFEAWLSGKQIEITEAMDALGEEVSGGIVQAELEGGPAEATTEAEDAEAKDQE
jgi:cytochrome c oxidase subunit 2